MVDYSPTDFKKGVVEFKSSDGYDPCPGTMELHVDRIENDDRPIISITVSEEDGSYGIYFMDKERAKQMVKMLTNFIFTGELA